MRRVLTLKTAKEPAASRPSRLVLLLVVAVTTLFTAFSVTAAEVVSNLSQSSDDTYIADYEGPEAQGFTTDNATYQLDSVTIDVVAVEDSSGNLTLRIFSDNSGLPGSMVPNGLLSGPGNPSPGLNTYTASGITLQPNTTYWIVAQVSSGSGAYVLSFTDSTSETGVWTLLDYEAYSSDYGASWDQDEGVMRVSISADTDSAAIPTLDRWGAFLLLLSISVAALWVLKRSGSLPA